MRDPWGVDQLPETTVAPPLPPGLAAHAEVARTGIPLRVDDDYVEPENLPEVQALIEQGWSALSDAPVNYLVPAAWPARHRCWVRDRTPTAHHQGSSTSDYYGWITPIDSFEPTPWSLSEEIAADAEKGGLPEPPPDRRWLVRSPWPGIEVDDVLWLMTRCGEAPLMTGEARDRHRRVRAVAGSARPFCQSPAGLDWQCSTGRCWHCRVSRSTTRIGWSRWGWRGRWRGATPGSARATHTSCYVRTPTCTSKRLGRSTAMS